MRCKKHPCQPSGSGVCPLCLRERLLDLLAAQAQEEALALPEKNHGDRRRETPLPFPRSVSPYVSSQSRRSERLFYSTPQLNPSSSVLSNRNSSYSKPRSRFSIFSSLFGKKDNDPVKDNDSVRVSWFSSLIRKKKSRLFSVDVSENATATATAATVAARASVEETRRKYGGRTDRGMSPVRKMRWEEEEELGFGSGYSSESSSRTRTTTTPAKKLGFQEEKQRRIRVLPQRNQSGLKFCLSPLMRPSPNHRQHRHHHGEQNGWDSFSGEIRNSGNKYCSSNPSFCANRSRKLADFGRYP